MGEESDADRIRRLLAGRNQAAFARAAGVPGGASMVSQHLSGHRPVSIEAALAYARGLGVPLSAVSPSAADVVRAASQLLDAQPTAPPDLDEVVPVVLRAMAECAAKNQLRTALLALLEDDSPLYRQRIAELLSPQPCDDARRTGTERRQQPTLLPTQQTPATSTR